MTVLLTQPSDLASPHASQPGSAGYPRFLPVGDAALTVEFGDSVDPELNARVLALDTAVNAAELDGIVETVPSYRSLFVCYDPMEISFHRLEAELRRLTTQGTVSGRARGAIWNVPVIYDPPYADNLAEVADSLALTEEQVIALHTGAEYRVFALGFAPGFPYLGGLPAALHISRRHVPRQQVPPGAVAIGGVQAAIFPIRTPTGWYMLGQTPLRPFDPDRQDPFLFRAGDHLRFRRIDRDEFERLSHLGFDELLRLIRSPE